MPQRSSGCYMCRRRKIRCDETRPRCRKCATHGVQCPGYRTEQPGGIEFKDQTDLTAQRAQGDYVRAELVRQSKSPSAGSARTTVSSPDLDRLKVEDYDDILFTPVLPVNVLSPSATRAQLYGTALDLYLPRGAKVDHFSFFKRIAKMPTEEPALVEALDALSLVTVGNASKDQRLLKQSVNSYGKALASLAKAISRPDGVVRDDLLAAVTVMATCALYDEIGQNGTGWGSHVKGGQQLVMARGPQSITTELGLLLFSNARHGAFVWALIERKAPLMAQPEWRALAFESPIVDSSTMFYDSAIQVPGLLERYEVLRTQPSPMAQEVDDLLQECQTIEALLRDWYADWSTHEVRSPGGTVISGFSRAEGGLLYREQPIDDFTVFTSSVSDRTFETAFMFPSFPIAYLCSLYWMCMHYLRTNIQSLHTLRHTIDEDWYPVDDQAVQEPELYLLASNLCRCIPFFCEPISSSTGHVGIFLPMRVAAVYFMSHGHWREAKWVGAVRTSVFTKGLSPPNITNMSGASKRPDQIALYSHETAFGTPSIKFSVPQNTDTIPQVGTSAGFGSVGQES